MTFDEIDNRIKKLIERHKKFYQICKNGKETPIIRKKMMSIAAEISWLLEEKRRLRSDIP
ncbi:MAG TPA: hypothetical protein GXX35_11430 [Thermoanaerobacterales bacterium]|nr:hypothetical protein [Thermoanaerobacterales bacterium]